VNTSDHPITRRLIHTATMLTVADLATSTTFYCDTLGFTVREQRFGIVLLELRKEIQRER